MTAGVEPKLKAMSCVAERVEAMEARVRCGRPWLKLNKVPKIGKPFGPGIEIRPIWFLPFLQATAPLGKARARSPMERSATRTTKIRLFSMLCVPAMAGRVNTHQFVSKDVEGNPIVLDNEIGKREVEGESERVRE